MRSISSFSVWIFCLERSFSWASFFFSLDVQTIDIMALSIAIKHAIKVIIVVVLWFGA